MTRPFEGVPGEQLDREIRELEDELQVMRARPLRFRDDVEATIRHSVEIARKRCDAVLRDALRKAAHSAGDAVIPPLLADVWLLAHRPAVAERWLELLEEDAATNTGGGLTVAGLRVGETRAGYERRRDELQREVALRRAELKLRDRLAVAAEAEAEIAELSKAAA